jgi:outer membrane protein assembly factor BamB
VNAAYDNGTVFVLNFDGLLQSFDANTGTPGWSVQLPVQWDFTSPLTASNGVVYALGQGDAGTLYAVNESTGTLNWSVNQLGTGGSSAPTLSSSSVFVAGQCDAYAFSLTPATSSGQQLWHDNFGCGGGAGRTAVLSSTGLYARYEGVPGSNYSLDPSSGAVTGGFTAGPTPAFSGSTGYYLSSYSNGTLSAVDSSLNTLWSFAGDGGLDSAPIVVKGDIYVGSSSGMLYELNATTGQTVWSTNVGSGITASNEGGTSVITGLGAGEGHLLVPAGSTLVAYVDSDSTPPVISSSVSGPQGPNGWYTGPTTVSWNVSDPETGVASSSGCGTTTLSADTTGTTLTCTATNGSGLTSSSSVTVKLDVSPPTLSCGSAPTGWSASDVSISCQAADAYSGLAGGSPSSFTLSTGVPAGTETSSASTPSQTVCDLVGHCATAGPYTGLRVDKKAPSITLNSPSATTYTLNQTVAASYSCADGGSGVASCAGPVASGQPINTASVGNKTFSVNAADAVGNQATPVSVGYIVTYGVCQSSVPTIKSGHAGNVSVQLCDAKSVNVSSPSVVVTAAGIYTSSGTLVRSLSNNFSYASGAYTEKVDTTGLASGTYYVAFTAGGDPVRHQAAFAVR